MPLLRLDKLLVNLGVGTRSEVKKIIVSGRVSIDDKIIKSSDFKVDTDKMSIKLDSKELIFEEFEYYIINKPAGYISATKDKIHKTVMELIPSKKKDLVPVGRLDIDTEGIMLITNDGKLNHNLLAPNKHVDKTYYAIIKGILPYDVENRFKEGIELNDGITKPAILNILSTKENEAEVALTIHEGRFHQVKRMFLYFDCEVIYLKRIVFAGLILDEKALPPGSYKKLDDFEIKRLKGL